MESNKDNLNSNSQSNTTMLKYAGEIDSKNEKAKAKLYYDPRIHVFKDLPEDLHSGHLDDILIRAVKLGASDVFFATDDKIRADIHGLKFWLTSKETQANQIEIFVKKIYSSDTGVSILNSGRSINDIYIAKEKYIDENGREQEKRYRFRINISAMMAQSLMTPGYEITARTIPDIPPLVTEDEIPKEIIDIFEHTPNGIILVVGATGSGKSTLLAGLIHHKLRNSAVSKKILSFEAPIEFVYTDVKQPYSFIRQAEVPTMSPSFKIAIEEALRRKPDDIFVGEMRDTETITQAIAASQFGHLLYSTMHVNSVAETIQRVANIYDTGEKKAKVYDMLAASRLIISQRLRPTLDGKRCAVREYIVMDDKIKQYIQDQPDWERMSFYLEEMLWKYGVPFAVHARQLVLEGKISEVTFKEFVRDRNVTIEELDKRIKELKEQGNVMFLKNNL